MFKVFLTVFLLFFVSSNGFTQERIDVIHLKNGDILKGIIIENEPNNFVRIEFTDGSIRTIKYADILKLAKEKRETKAQDAQMDMQKMMYYDSQKKSPGTAAILSLLFTSAGHAYAGNWPRGLLFTGGKVISVLVMVSGVQTKSEPYTYSFGGRSYTYYTYYTELTAAYYLGLGGLIILTIWEPIDAAETATKYNKDLYERIMGKRPYSLNIAPYRDGALVQFAYRF